METTSARTVSSAVLPHSNYMTAPSLCPHLAFTDSFHISSDASPAYLLRLKAFTIFSRLSDSDSSINTDFVPPLPHTPDAMRPTVIFDFFHLSYTLNTPRISFIHYFKR
jgi:hypothetical protein